MKINNISSSTPVFPERLRNIPSAPKELYYLGNISLDAPVVSIIGTRKPTPYGSAVTFEIAEKLASRGVVIVSGLALGIDGIAHQGALKARGRTIAVQGNGLDMITPRTHRQLAIDILECNGGIISEHPPGTPASHYSFVVRNRLVSGLCDALIVTEAATKSGTMNTVMHALEQGREVFAVPGNITSPMSAGCNRLIEQGATPIVDIDAFIERIAPKQALLSSPLLQAYSEDEKCILELISNGISDGDQIAVQSGLKPEVFQRTMTMLELSGAISPLGANQWKL